MSANRIDNTSKISLAAKQCQNLLIGTGSNSAFWLKSARTPGNILFDWHDVCILVLPGIATLTRSDEDVYFQPVDFRGGTFNDVASHEFRQASQG